MKRQKMSNELEKLQHLIHSVNKGGYSRCSICNSVSNESIQTNIGDFRPHMSFAPDPKDTMHEVCIECKEVIQSVLDEYTDETDDLLEE
jgi:hypothetical protein